MRKIKLLLASLLLGQIAFAGGMVTNTNQSAAYIRMLARDASTDVDAVFYNPAALTKLPDGFYVQVNTQTVLQSRSINNSYLNKEYKGDVFVPVLPTAFFAYKTGNWAFSGGFTVIGGGGSANYEQGLPDFEVPFKGIVDLVNSQAPGSLNNYSADISFNGSSIYYGGQAGVSYAINDNISVFAGARYVVVHNTYEGHIKNVSYSSSVVSDGTTLEPAADIFNALAAAITSTGGDASTMDALKAATVDREVDVEQKGSAITPIVGANISLLEDKLNIGLKYEFATKIDIENYSYKDDTKYMNGINDPGMFPDRAIVAADMPAFLSVGLGYQVTSKFYVTGGLHYYFDKGVDYGKNGWEAGWNPAGTDAPIYARGDNSNWVEGNSYELGLGLEYQLTDLVALSGGYLYSSSSPAINYQSGLSYSLNSSTVAAGANFNLSQNLDLDFGVLYTMYSPYDKDMTISVAGNNLGSAVETYKKSNYVFSLGITYGFGGGSSNEVITE